MNARQLTCLEKQTKTRLANNYCAQSKEPVGSDPRRVLNIEIISKTSRVLKKTIDDDAVNVPEVKTL
jgi:hypothetical protein